MSELKNITNIIQQQSWIFTLMQQWGFVISDNTPSLYIDPLHPETHSNLCLAVTSHPDIKDHSDTDLDQYTRLDMLAMELNLLLQCSTTVRLECDVKKDRYAAPATKIPLNGPVEKIRQHFDKIIFAPFTNAGEEIESLCNPRAQQSIIRDKQKIQRAILQAIKPDNSQGNVQTKLIGKKPSLFQKFRPPVAPHRYQDRTTPRAITTTT